jgi:hypothetical protein
MIKESNFRNFKGINGISIANSQPKPEKFEVYKPLQPGWKLVNDWKAGIISNEEYETIYRKQVLGKLNREKVIKDLDGKTLLCWCTGSFCHRFIVIKWLNEPHALSGEW